MTLLPFKPSIGSGVPEQSSGKGPAASLMALTKGSRFFFLPPTDRLLNKLEHRLNLYFGGIAVADFGDFALKRVTKGSDSIVGMARLNLV